MAAVTIGQAPRPDLLEPLVARIGDDTVVDEYGALDGLTLDRIPVRPNVNHADGDAYPLTTRLRDGTRVMLDEADLVPLVQRAIDRADDAGADVTLLLCAGGFEAAAARASLIRPFEAAVAELRGLAALRIAVVVPFVGQAEPSRRKWAAAGFEPTVVVGDPPTVDIRGSANVDAIALDYVGHSLRDVGTLRARSTVRVIDLGEAGADAATAALVARPVAAAERGR